MSEETNIIKLIAAEDKTAFKALYDRFSSLVYNTAISYIQDSQDAEEITQDVFVNIYRNAGQFRAQSSIKTWIYRITVNTSLNYIKKKKRTSIINMDLHTRDKIDFDHPGVLLENKEDARLLFQFINALPEKQKTAFILSFVEFLPQKEVADIMGISLKAVESLLQRGKKKLKEKIERSELNRRNNK